LIYEIGAGSQPPKSSSWNTCSTLVQSRDDFNRDVGFHFLRFGVCVAKVSAHIAAAAHSSTTTKLMAATVTIKRPQPQAHV
jgi:hypothetical protein